MQTLYHGSRVVVEQPEIRIQKFHKDFYWGFYCTSYEQQALRWATRFGKAGVVNVYSFDDQTELKIKRFLEMSDEWLDFIAACRNGVPHDYDVVEGPMADDTIFNYVQSFLDGEISRAAFWELAKFKYPTPSDQLPHCTCSRCTEIRKELCCQCARETMTRSFSPVL